MQYPYLSVFDEGREASLLDNVELTAEVAESIRSFTGNLNISEINLLPSEFVVELMKDFKGSSLTLFGNFDLASEAAELLSKVQGNLSFPDLEKLSVAAASQLANHTGGYLGLNGIPILSEELAAALSKHHGNLELNSLSEMSEAACLQLAKHRECISMENLDPDTLTPAAIEAFKTAWPDVWGNV
jgi:hypothetical protein